MREISALRTRHAANMPTPTFTLPPALAKQFTRLPARWARLHYRATHRLLPHVLPGRRRTHGPRARRWPTANSLDALQMRDTAAPWLTIPNPTRHATLPPHTTYICRQFATYHCLGKGQGHASGGTGVPLHCLVETWHCFSVRRAELDVLARATCCLGQAVTVACLFLSSDLYLPSRVTIEWDKHPPQIWTERGWTDRTWHTWQT